MRLYLVRHTKVDTPSGWCYGQTDVGLFNTFQSERDAIISELDKVEFKQIYSSPLKRCALLAEHISGGNIKYDDRLMELDFGDWENRSWRDFENSPEAKLRLIDYVNIACPGGESYSDLLDRVEDFLDDLRGKYSDGNVLIVTHSGIIRAFYSLINRVKPHISFELNVDYGQISEIEL
jgi:alpha-ribazole phosphatase